DHLLGHITLGSATRIRVAPPLLRQEEPFVDQRIALPGGTGSKHTYLAIVDLAQGATVLAGPPHRVLAFLAKPALIDDEYPIRHPPLLRPLPGTLLGAHALLLLW